MQLDPGQVEAGQDPAEGDLDVATVGDRDQHAGGGGVVVAALAAAVAEHVDVDPVPAESTPQDGLDHPDALDPVDRDRLAGEVEQATRDPDPASRLRQGEVEHLEDPSTDHRGQPDGQRDQPGQGEGHHVEPGRDDQSDDQERGREQELTRQQEAHDEALRWHGHQGLVRGGQVGEHARRPDLGLADPHPVAVRAAEQVVAQRRRLLTGEIAQLDGGVAGTDLDPQLGETEDPGRELLDDVDRLHPLERHPLGVLEDRPGLDPQLFVVDHVAGEVPGREAGRRRQHHDADDAEQDPAQAQTDDARFLTGAVRDELAPEPHHDGQQHDPAADEWGQRMRPLGLLDGPGRGLGGRRRLDGCLRWVRFAHSPEACASPSWVS